MSGKNPGDVARGLKGASNNPNNSEEARESARDRLDDLERNMDKDEAHAGQVERGHKAAISNPNTSNEAKNNSKNIIGGN